MSVAGTEQFDDHDNHYEQQSVIGANTRIVITQEGILDPSLLIRTEGYLYKKGGAVNARGGFRNWKKRFFVLAPVDFFGYQGYELQYYDAPNGTLKGTVALNDVDVYVDSKSANKKVKHEFQLILQNGGELQLSCDSEEERDEWVKTLQTIVDFLHKVATQPAMMLDGYDPMMEDDLETFTIGEELAQNCQAFGPGLFGSEAGKSTQFVVNIYDLAGQRVTKGSMPIVATITNDDSLYYLALIDNDDGSYYCNYVLGTAGKYQLSITLNEEHHIFGSPFDIEILPSKTVPKFCVAEGDLLQQMATKSTGTFTIYAMDGFGNRKSRGGDPFEVSIMGPGQVIDLEDRNDGSYICTVTATNVQQTSQQIFTSPSIMIMVSLYGKAIQGSPFKPVMIDGNRSQSFLAQATNNNNTSNADIANNSNNSSSNNAVVRPASRVPAASNNSVKSAVSATPSNSNNNVNGNASVQSSVKTSTHIASAAPTQPNSANNANFHGSSNSSVASSARTPPPPPAAAPAPPAATTFSSSFTGSNLKDVYGSANNNNYSNNGNNSNSSNVEANLQGLSRLERSRQRALLAKAMTEQNAANNNHSNTTAKSYNAVASPAEKRVLLAPPSPSPVTPNNSNTNNTTANNSNNNSNNVASGRLAQLAARSKMTLEALKTGQQTPAQQQQQQQLQQQRQNSSNNQHNQHLSPAHQDVVRNLVRGMLTETASPQIAPSPLEQRLWHQVHTMLTGPASTSVLLDHIVPHLDILTQVFAFFADSASSSSSSSSAGEQPLLRLATATGYGGLLKMLEVYEIIPHFVNRLEIKTMFALALAVQKSSTPAPKSSLLSASDHQQQTSAASSSHVNGLDFAGFVRLLLLVANGALNKAQAFADQYASPESRVDFVLLKLGVADAGRFQAVRRSLLQANTADI